MQELQDAMEDWERYQSIPREQFFSSRDTRNMVFHAILVAIQSAIDIATDIIAEKRLQKPVTYRETFEILESNGMISESLAKELAALASFRNVLVHIYWDLDLEAVYTILQHDLVYLKEFRAVIQDSYS